MKKINKHQIIELILLSIIVILIFVSFFVSCSKPSNNPTSKKHITRETVLIKDITHIYHQEQEKFIETWKNDSGDKWEEINKRDREFYSTYKFTLKTSIGTIELLSDVFPKVESKDGGKYYVILQYQNGDYFFPNAGDMFWDDWVWDNK